MAMQEMMFHELLESGSWEIEHHSERLKNAQEKVNNLYLTVHRLLMKFDFYGTFMIKERGNYVPLSKLLYCNNRDKLPIKLAITKDVEIQYSYCQKDKKITLSLTSALRNEVLFLIPVKYISDHFFNKTRNPTELERYITIFFRKHLESINDEIVDYRRNNFTSKATV